MSHTLRVYKHGASGYTEVTDSMAGGFTNLELTRVRNQPGELKIDLEATTPAMLGTWIDEAATIELWQDATRVHTYRVDDYTPRWSDMTCRISAVGMLADLKGAPFTGAYTSGSTGTSVVSGIVAAVPTIGWDAAKVTGTSGNLPGAVVYTGKPAFDALAELALILGVDYWIDADGDLNTAPWATSVSRTFTLNDDAYEFDTTYSAREIVNRLELNTAAGVFVFDETASQAAYGVRMQKVSATGIVSAEAAAAWADNVFASLAWPIQQIGLEVAHDGDLAPGIRAAVSGVADGRTYADVVSQVSWTIGDLTDRVQIGHLPPTLSPPDSLAVRDGTPGKDGKDAPYRDVLTVTANYSDGTVLANVASTNLAWNPTAVALTLWKLDGSTWSPADTQYADAAGEVVFTVSPPISGSDIYRVKCEGAYGYGPAVSSTVEIAASVAPSDLVIEIASKVLRGELYSYSGGSWVVKIPAPSIWSESDDMYLHGEGVAASLGTYDSSWLNAPIWVVKSDTSWILAFREAIAAGSAYLSNSP